MPTTPRIGLVLAGCGFKDGAEIHESVVAMLALEEAGAVLDLYAPDKPQTKTTNHKTGDAESATRNVMVEAARIARGKVRPLKEARAADLDGVVIPGGFGAALNLCDFGLKGAAMQVDPDLERLLKAMHGEKKPIGAICIAPAILAKVFGPLKPRLTIGNDAETAGKLEQLGVDHVDCKVDQIVIDQKHLLVTTPAYMLAESVRDIHQGIRKLADEVVRLARAR